MIIVQMRFRTGSPNNENFNISLFQKNFDPQRGYFVLNCKKVKLSKTPDTTDVVVIRLVDAVAREAAEVAPEPCVDSAILAATPIVARR